MERKILQTSRKKLTSKYLNLPILIFSFTLCFISQLAWWQTIEIPLTRVDLSEPILPDNHELISEEEATRRGLTANITMTNYLNVQYYASLLIGSNQDSMNFIWDTGSTLLWVPLNNCSSCPSSTKYTPAASYATTGQSYTITYAVGQVSGGLANDQVRLNATTNPITMGKLHFSIFRTARRWYRKRWYLWPSSWGCPRDGAQDQLKWGWDIVCRGPTYSRDHRNQYICSRVQKHHWCFHDLTRRVWYNPVCFHWQLLLDKFKNDNTLDSRLQLHWVWRY